MDMDFGGGLGASSLISGSVRVIPTLSGSQYGTLSTVLAVTVGDTVRREISTTNSGARMFLFGHSSTPMSAEFDAGNLLQLIGCTATVNGTAVADGASVAAYEDGKVRAWEFTATGSLSIGYLNQDGAGANFFIGQDLSFSYTISGVTTSIVFDSGSDLYQLPRGEVIGSELSGDPTCDNESYWDLTNGTTFDGDGVDISYSGGFTSILQRLATSEPATIGTTVECEVVISSYTSGSVDVRAGTTSFGSASSEGTFKLVGEVTVDGRIQISSSDFVGTISKFSVKQLPDTTCLLTNFATTDWNRFTLQKNIVHDAGTIAEAWIGSELAINGTFDDGLTGWVTSNITVVDGQAIAGVAGGFLYQDITVINGMYVLFLADKIGTPLIPQTPLGLSLPSASLSATIARIQFNPDEGEGADNISLRQILEVA